MNFTTPRRRARPSAGFTLVELMVTLTIGAIILGIAAPSFSELMGRYRLTDASRNLSDRLLIAANFSESQGPVTICVSSDGENCIASDDWGQGYIVFSDGGTVGTIDGTDMVLERALPVTTGVSIRSAAEVGGTSVATGRVYFQEGTPDIANAIRFTVCQSAGEPRHITLNRIGSLRQWKGTTPCA